MYIIMSIAMCKGMCTDMHIAMCTEMCTGVHIGMCRGMCIEMPVPMKDMADLVSQYRGYLAAIGIEVLD